MRERKFETVLVQRENVDLTFLVDIIADKIRHGALTTTKRKKEKKTA